MDQPNLPADAVGDDRCPGCHHEVGMAWLVCAWCGRPLAAPAELPVGSRLADGRYQVLGVLGRGGFGITYDVGDRRLHRRVAVKELFPESAVRHGSVVLTPPHARAGFAEARDRFLREARVLARFTHPGIVRVYEVFEEHGTAYLVMELLEGRNLVELLLERGRPFREDEVVEVATRVAAALRPVHAVGVLHRDVNPSNVMLTNSGRIVVIDFGLARDFTPDRTVGMTRVVTPGYAPVEQYRGEGRFGPFTDVYGLAATCYRLATGTVPVGALDRDGGATLVSPQRRNPAISKPVSDAILDGLEFEPSHRPQDLDSFLARLGVARLPDAPRSTLIETFPAAAPVAAPVPVPVPVTGPTEIVRPTPVPTPVTAMTSALPDDRTWPAPGGALGADATRPIGPAPRLLESDATSVTVIGPGSVARAVQDPESPLSPRSVGELPRITGPGNPGRRKLIVPAVAVLLAAASAAPVLVCALVVLVLLPALATHGDTVHHRLRLQHGVGDRWIERHLPPGALVPTRFFRNVAMGVLRASPLLVIGAVLLGGWYGLEHLSAPAMLGDLVLRGIGVLVVGLVLAASREGSPRFQTGAGIEDLVGRWVPEGRTTEALVAFWVIAVLLIAGALWLDPDAFPLS